jgi:hypothetical protein
MNLKHYLRSLTAQADELTIQKSDVSKPQSSLHVLLRLLLLCMRVRWRGEVADLRIHS